MITRIIVVCGSPGSGKTTLAHKLGSDLRIPVISKDHFKDAMMDVAPPENRAASGAIGRFSWAAMYAACDALIGAVPTMIVEANFNRQFAAGELLPRLRQGDASIVYCTADQETILQRIRARANDPTRHPGHFDQDAIPDVLRLLKQDAFRLELPGIPMLTIETSDGYVPSWSELLRFAGNPGD